eukprot:TRINITY_DN28164_c0_g1_i1.p1 TRINITY_DN28164_c0_g1~~TRINITY_DN28164_c0_g1_i1.p1  ORF type:complete len:131 (+),score=6.72 TRINITY_DN28164_c0_g1_i1:1-393(+)
MWLVSLLVWLMVVSASVPSNCGAYNLQDDCIAHSCSWCNSYPGVCYDAKLETCCTRNSISFPFFCNTSLECCQSYHPTSGFGCCTPGVSFCCGYFVSACCPVGTTCCALDSTAEYINCCLSNQTCSPKFC